MIPIMNPLPDRRTGDDPSLRAVQHVVESDLAAWCDFLNVKLVGPGELLSSTLSHTSPDLLVRVGPDRLLHTEYFRGTEADIYTRMLEHRVQIMRRYPQTRLSQYVVLLGAGRVQMHDDPEAGFFLGLRVVSLPRTDPDEFLRRPNLAPLAGLSYGNQVTRKRSFVNAFGPTEHLPREDRQRQLETILNLAAVSLDPAVHDSLRQELSSRQSFHISNF